MSLTAEDISYLNWALAALPRWMNPGDEFLHGAAKLFGSSVQPQIDYWITQTFITTATGATLTTPDWLNQHARDRGTSRQNGESDAALAARLRNTPDALTRLAILNAANLILQAAGISTPAAMIEQPRDSAHCGSFIGDAGTGGTFASIGSAFAFQPTVPFVAPPYRDPSVVRLIQSYAITIAGAAHAGNDGTFQITGLNGNYALYTNGSGVVGADAGATWTVIKQDRRGNSLNGHGKAHCNRGARVGHGFTPLHQFRLILPYGTTPGVTASITEMLRQKKAAGVAVAIETRLVP